jgi:hypothetical protein
VDNRVRTTGISAEHCDKHRNEVKYMWANHSGDVVRKKLIVMIPTSCAEPGLKQMAKVYPIPVTQYTSARSTM